MLRAAAGFREDGASPLGHVPGQLDHFDSPPLEKVVKRRVVRLTRENFGEDWSRYANERLSLIRDGKYCTRALRKSATLFRSCERVYGFRV